jgi:hypothetical protein
VREGQPGGYGGDLQGASFGAAMAFLTGVMGDGDLPPGQPGELGAQAGLVAFDGDQVVRAALAGQVLGMSALRVQGIGGDDRPGQVDAVKQGWRTSGSRLSWPARRPAPKTTLCP